MLAAIVIYRFTNVAQIIFNSNYFFIVDEVKKFEIDTFHFNKIMHIMGIGKEYWHPSNFGVSYNIHVNFFFFF